MFGSNRGTRNRYRSKRSVSASALRQPQRDVPTHLITNWTRTKIVLVTIGALLLATTTLLPVFILESTSMSGSQNSNSFKAPVSLHNLVEKSINLEQEYKDKGLSFWSKAKKSLHVHVPGEPITSQQQHVNEHSEDAPKDHGVRGDATNKASSKSKKTTGKESTIENEHVDTGNGEGIAIVTTTKAAKTKQKQQQLARGVSGLPMSQTPALIGARPGHIDCDVDVDDIVYWNDPQGTRDQEFKSPFATPPEHYLTFEPDPGGWNNIRMSMEIIFVLAAVTGRTLVLPPKAPFYLLGMGKENARSFGIFYELSHPEFRKKINIITMEEFLRREGTGILNLSEEQVEEAMPIAEMCLHKTDSEIFCDHLYEHLRKAGVQPDMEAATNCYVFDVDHFQGKNVSAEVKNRVARFCGSKREAVYYDKAHHEPRLIHWDASAKTHRLLNHFYSFLFFTDPAIDNVYKRFVRDFFHYKDEIYCAAGKIVHALNEEGKSWSSLHVRRGDLQYKKVKLSAEEWYANTKEIWNEGEILFIATDERNKTFFDPIKQHHEVRFLDDYWDSAKLGDLDSYFLGMIDTIVASHGRAFAGTWFSTFTGYINRMRGYLGHPMKNSWYSWPERKDAMQEYEFPEGNYPAREWPIGWVAIDGDEVIEHEGAPVIEQAREEPNLGEQKVGEH
jgi:hypothetical protein